MLELIHLKLLQQRIHLKFSWGKLEIINIIKCLPLVFFNLGTDRKENHNFKTHYGSTKGPLTFFIVVLLLYTQLC